MKAPLSKQYPMNGKFYIIIHWGEAIAYGVVAHDSIKYINFKFHMVKRGSIFHRAFEPTQVIRFRRPFEGYIFEYIPEDEKPFKATELKYFERSKYVTDKFYAKKTTKKS